MSRLRMVYPLMPFNNHPLTHLVRDCWPKTSCAGNIPGPKITAFQSMILSGHGLPEIPPGGSVESRLKSRIRRRRQLVDYRHCELWHMTYRLNDAVRTMIEDTVVEIKGRREVEIEMEMVVVQG